ncbi:glutamine--tRNA ligase/YqeY domain fusion protein [candidate division KSB1 bacterium]|nr:glutamine--tRNA ligase/YqeY domain fusion protein [candidate division KSB1 bacterium]
MSDKNQDNTKPTNFIRAIIDKDLETGKHDYIITRFPPEPNGYLHIGHAKSICLNFGIARDYNGRCHLRFDDTNPMKEEMEYIESIKQDVKWLGFDWGEHEYHASDYFDQLYQYAIELIKKSKAYVEHSTQEEIRQMRGTLKEPGKESPYRNRTVEENLDLFERMRDGEFDEGECVLRARIDMASPNLNMRDPVIYRILKAPHPRTGKKWSIYPMYDFAHGISDAIEGITHSICTLEFEDHRPLYDWFLDQVSVPCHPQQIEFARLNLSYTLMSKRKLLQLVREKIVDGWDDPRMPTVSGLRRRGYTPESIRDFSDRIGVAKRDSMVDLALLEYCVREDLNKRARRYMGVLDPIKVVITNYPEDKVEMLKAVNNPEDESMGTRQVPFSRVIYIERDDFKEDPPKKFFRLSPGKEVRLRYAYYITCVEVIKDEEDNIVELHCTFDPKSRGGFTPDRRRVKGTLHWVSAQHAAEATVRLYEPLFTLADLNDMEEDKDFHDYLNPDSLTVLENCQLEPALADLDTSDRVQFERKGYFVPDHKEYSSEKPVFNRIVTLRDTWAKIEKSMKKGE